jgi:hypothetical protein
MEAKQIELSRQLRTAQDKYIYFLLAASSAGVALAINQTRDALISWSMVPLGFAVLAWGLSFFFGCRHLAFVASNLYANFDLLKVQSGLHPAAGTHPEVIAAAAEGIRSAIESNSREASRLARWQFRSLIVGALFYLCWHITEMTMRTIAASAQKLQITCGWSGRGPLRELRRSYDQLRLRRDPRFTTGWPRHSTAVLYGSRTMLSRVVTAGVAVVLVGCGGIAHLTTSPILFEADAAAVNRSASLVVVQAYNGREFRGEESLTILLGSKEHPQRKVVTPSADGVFRVDFGPFMRADIFWVIPPFLGLFIDHGSYVLIRFDEGAAYGLSIEDGSLKQAYRFGPQNRLVKISQNELPFVVEAEVASQEEGVLEIRLKPQSSAAADHRQRGSIER